MKTEERLNFLQYKTNPNNTENRINNGSNEAYDSSLDKENNNKMIMGSQLPDWSLEPTLIVKRK